MTKRHRFGALGFGLVLAAGCAPGSLVDVQQPIDIVDPGQVNSRSGAIALRNTAIGLFSSVLNGNGQSIENFVTASGQFSDEFQPNASAFPFGMDARFALAKNFGATLENTGDRLYVTLQYARTTAQNARGLLATYAPDDPLAGRGRLASLEAFIEVYLSELYCSGIPIGRVPVGTDAVYTRGLTTVELSEHAVALFDTAMVLSADTARFLNLARVGKGRALLNLGRYSEAVAAVAAVPDGFVFNAEHTDLISSNTAINNYLGKDRTRVTVTNREGINGMDWITAADPRVVVQTTGVVNAPQKYTAASSPTPVATAVEARLIEAEADLRANGTQWLTILNRLRTSCPTSVGCATPAPAGTGGVAGLPVLPDPGVGTLPPGKTATDVRVDLLFRERAFWLFATGHRQGDLRRLLRQYGRPESATYPTGAYTHSSAFGLIPSYGTAVVLIPGDAERHSNPLYSGCTNLNP